MGYYILNFENLIALFCEVHKKNTVSVFEIRSFANDVKRYLKSVDSACIIDADLSQSSLNSYIKSFPCKESQNITFSNDIFTISNAHELISLVCQSTKDNDLLLTVASKIIADKSKKYKKV